MFGLEFYVGLYCTVDTFAFKRCGFANHLPGNAHHHRIGRDLHALLADGTGGNDRTGPHAHAIQQYCSHSHERIRLDDRTVDDGAVPDADAIADNGRESMVSMDDSAVLDVGVLADL